jgi:hypothetical protein
MELVLVYQLPTPGEDTVSVTISVLKSDGHESRMVEVFQTPPKQKISIRLQKQSECYQQFTIVNPFPVVFSFSSDGRANRVPPNTSYSFLRKASPDPLKLTVVEEGWDDFPVDVVATDFLTGSLIVTLTAESAEWTAGSPQFVRVNPPSFAVPNKDWIVVPQDIRGELHLFIPRRPGVIGMPDFQVGQQTCMTDPKTACVSACDYPPFVPF